MAPSVADELQQLFVQKLAGYLAEPCSVASGTAEQTSVLQHRATEKHLCEERYHRCLGEERCHRLSLSAAALMFVQESRLIHPTVECSIPAAPGPSFRRALFRGEPALLFSAAARASISGLFCPVKGWPAAFLFPGFCLVNVITAHHRP